MGKQKVGALIVIEHNVPLDEVVRTGELIDAAINQRLIENIFFKNSPLHDGAMVISKKRIKAAGCILPVSHDLNIPKELGLRHRGSYGNLSTVGCTRHYCFRRNGSYLCRLSRAILSSPECGRIGKYADKRKLILVLMVD